MTQATEPEMAEFARCQHHAKDSAVGQEYNRRKGITSMNCFLDILRFADLKRDQAQLAKDAARDAYAFKHALERAANKARRLEQKSVHVSKPASEPKPKNYGPAVSMSAGRKKKPTGEKNNKQPQGQKGKGR